MKTIGIMVGVALIVLALTGAGIGSEWNAGATARAEIAAQAQMHAADVQAQAAIYAADAATQRTAIIVAALPATLLLIISGIVLSIVVWHRGKAHVLKTQAMLPVGGQSVALLPPPPPVARLAAQRGAVPQLIDGEWMLIRDGAPVARVRQIAQKG